MNSLLRPTVIACALSLAFAGGALAQTVAAADPARTPGWVFTPSAALSTAWDDNVVLAGVRAPTVSDQVTLISGSADGQYLGRHNLLTFGYSGWVSAYRQLTELNSFDQRLRLDTRHTLSPHVTLLLHNGFARVPTTDFVELNGIPFLRTGSLMDDARGTLSVALSPRATLSGGYAFEWVKFDDSTPFTAFLKGGHAHTAFGELAYQVRKRVSLGGRFSYRRALVAEGGGEFGIGDAASTVHLDVTETLSLSGSLGLSRLTDSLRQTSQLGPVWSISAVQRLERASVSGSYVRSYVPSFGLGGTLQNQQFDANFTMPFLKNRLYAQAGISWRRNEPLTVGQQSLKSLWLTASAGYSIQRWLRLEGYYSRTQQDSQLRGGRVDRDRIGIQVVTSTPMRLK